MNRKQFIFLLFSSGAAILVCCIVANRPWNGDDEIALKVESLNAWNLDDSGYATIHFSISRINLSEVSSDGKFQVGNAIYARLSRKQRYWTIDGIFHKKPIMGEGERCMRGKVMQLLGNRLVVEWGTEIYRVPPEQRNAIMQAASEYHLTALVSVRPDCFCVLEELVVDEGTERIVPGTGRTPLVLPRSIS